METTTGYPAAWFFLAAFLLLTGILTVVGGAKLLVDIVGFVYPAYQSFKSMDSTGAGSAQITGDDTQWLTYWVVFSFLTIVESAFGFLTGLIPFYFWIKIAVLVVCELMKAELRLFSILFSLLIRSSFSPLVSIRSLLFALNTRSGCGTRRRGARRPFTNRCCDPWWSRTWKRRKESRSKLCPVKLVLEDDGTVH